MGERHERMIGDIVLGGDMSPHDEEDRGTDEGELYGAGEEEGAAVLH